MTEKSYVQVKRGTTDIMIGVPGKDGVTYDYHVFFMESDLERVRTVVIIANKDEKLMLSNTYDEDHSNEFEFIFGEKTDNPVKIYVDMTESIYSVSIEG